MRAIYVSGHEPEGGAARRARRPVTEVMSSPVLSVSVDTRLGDALEAMVRTGRRHLVVVDTAGRCAGVLADRAVAAAWAHDHAALTRLTVAQALDPDPAVVNSHAKVVDAARLMRARGVDAVAVLNPDGLPMGIVTGSDLIALLAG
ncbi:hypothetical protein Vlu01_26080 [Micromonospora lutea]|uniref:CBS domain-containing protein n=2 Tax=Micromonospora lutea TaxID=419825 RepID=A0ABQ4IVN0_9ACTN|nr:hypothetical protein Vlu01_26080 [Micromonospora lutea]